MKSPLFTMAGLPAMALLTTAAFAAEIPIEQIDVSANGTPAMAGELKNQNACPDGTYLKNFLPGLTNGTNGGSTTVPIVVDGKAVDMTIEWGPLPERADPPRAALPENSFGFSLEGESAYALEFGVTTNTNNFTYDYRGPLAPVQSDSNLNKLIDELLDAGEVIADVNHLDLCLAGLDSDEPEVGIRVEPTIDGTTVSGIISIIATVTDESPVNVSISITSTDGTVTVDPSLIEQQPTSGNEYTWTLDTGRIPVGGYVIAVTAIDTSILLNFVTEQKNIFVVRTFENCFEGNDAIPTGEDGEGGCPEAGVTLEYPEALRNEELPPLTVSQAGIPAIQGAAGNQTALCGLDDEDGSVLYEFVAQDPRVDADGNVIDVRSLDLRELFAIDDHFAQFHPGDEVPLQVILDDTTYGAVCLSLYHQDAPEFDFLQQYLQADFFLGFSLSAYLADPANNPRPVSVLSQGPEDVPGMFAASDRFTAPLNFCDVLSDSLCQPLPGCIDNPDPMVECYQPSQQRVERAIVQPDNIALLVRPFAFDGTFEVYNRSRTADFKGTFGILNARRVCPALEAPDSPYVPGTAAYLEAELECMVLQTLEVFYDTEIAIKEADDRNNLLSPDVTRLLNPHSKALGQIKNGHFERALRYLDDLLDEIYRGSWTIDENNDPGRLIMMVTALIFQVEQHFDTEACLEDPACLADYENQP